MCGMGCSEANDIISDLARETGTDVVIVDRDVRDFIEELKSKHLLQA